MVKAPIPLTGPREIEQDPGQQEIRIVDPGEYVFRAAAKVCLMVKRVVDGELKIGTEHEQWMPFETVAIDGPGTIRLRFDNGGRESGYAILERIPR